MLLLKIFLLLKYLHKHKSEKAKFSTNQEEACRFLQLYKVIKITTKLAGRPIPNLKWKKLITDSEIRTKNSFSAQNFDFFIKISIFNQYFNCNLFTKILIFSTIFCLNLRNKWNNFL